jgi:hypothetical protein
VNLDRPQAQEVSQIKKLTHPDDLSIHALAKHLSFLFSPNQREIYIRLALGELLMISSVSGQRSLPK